MVRKVTEAPAVAPVDIDALVATIGNLNEETVKGVHEKIKAAEDAAQPLRDERETINQEVIAGQAKAKALSAKILAAELPLRGLRKILTIGVKLGQIKGATVEVEAAKTRAKPQSVS